MSDIAEENTSLAPPASQPSVAALPLMIAGPPVAAFARVRPGIYGVSLLRDHSQVEVLGRFPGPALTAAVDAARIVLEATTGAIERPKCEPTKVVERDLESQIATILLGYCPSP